MTTDMFYIKIVGIIFNPEKREILLAKGIGQDRYSFIEGDLSYDEGLDVCLKNTIADKTGYKVHNLGAVYAENLLKDPKKLKIHFLCEASKGKIKKGDSIEELIWVKPKEVEEKLKVSLPTRLHEYLMNLA